MAEHPRLKLLPDGPHIEIDGDSLFLGRDCHLAVSIPGLKNKVDPNATMLEEDEPAGAATMLDSAEGSAERPFKVGRTPEIWLRHERTGHEFRAKGYTIVIGRDPTAAQVVIRTEDEKHVSGRHAEIQFRSDGSVVVRDFGSRNGSWLNDHALKDEAPLKVGDRLVLGSAPTTLVVTALER